MGCLREIHKLVPRDIRDKMERAKSQEYHHMNDNTEIARTDGKWCLDRSF